MHYKVFFNMMLELMYVDSNYVFTTGIAISFCSLVSRPSDPARDQLSLLCHLPCHHYKVMPCHYQEPINLGSWCHADTILICGAVSFGEAGVSIWRRKYLEDILIL